MDIQAALKEKIRIKRKEDEDKIVKKWNGLQEKLKKTVKENKEEFEKLEEHNEERLLEQENIEHKRDLAVEWLVENKLEEDPILKMDDLAHVIGHLSRAITPRASHEAIPVHVNLNTNAQAPEYGMGAGGRSGSAKPELILLEDQHHHHE
jgi:hypothetical protein